MTMLRSIAKRDEAVRVRRTSVDANNEEDATQRQEEDKAIPVKRRPISTTAIYDKQRAKRLQGAKESVMRPKAEGTGEQNKRKREADDESERGYK